mmetsp:Transcript_37194/g.96066  ORF Transcript_37194/g.96066 Transcript_37194/m.96066 type:complete len:288 (-) Transcript_37194:843-1706(-)
MEQLKALPASITSTFVMDTLVILPSQPQGAHASVSLTGCFSPSITKYRPLSSLMKVLSYSGESEISVGAAVVASLAGCESPVGVEKVRSGVTRVGAGTVGIGGRAGRGGTVTAGGTPGTVEIGSADMPGPTPRDGAPASSSSSAGVSGAVVPAAGATVLRSLATAGASGAAVVIVSSRSGTSGRSSSPGGASGILGAPGAPGASSAAGASVGARDGMAGGGIRTQLCGGSGSPTSVSVLQVAISMSYFAWKVVNTVPSPFMTKSSGSQRLSLLLVHGAPPHQTQGWP